MLWFFVDMRMSCKSAHLANLVNPSKNGINESTFRKKNRSYKQKNPGIEMIPGF